MSTRKSAGPRNSLGRPWTEGEAWRCARCGKTGPDRDDVALGRRAHFASCPKADEFRKRTAAKKAEPGLFGDVAPKPAAGGDPL